MKENFTLPAEVSAALGALHSRDHEAYLVGGCVRDALLGRPISDYDITTSALPEETEACFSNLRVIETGLQHGTVTVLAGAYPLEITTFRTESGYSDLRHPDTVSFTRSLREDLSRRDFTVNAMARSPETGLVDLFGGEEDLNNRVIRCVGNPDTRFGEDALRILRALRFAAQLGFTLEHETAESVHRNRELLRAVAPERIFVELKKLLCGPGVREILLEYPDVLGVFLPELLPMVGFDQHTKYHIYDVWTHTVEVVAHIPPEPVDRLSALLHDIGKPASFFRDPDGTGHFYGHPAVSRRLSEEILTRLKADNDTKNAVLLAVEHHDLVLEPTERSMRRGLNRFGREGLERILRLQRADNLAQAPAYRGRQEAVAEMERIASELVAREECFSLKQLAVTGRDLKEAGFAPGPEMGDTLNALLSHVLDGVLPNEKEALLAAAWQGVTLREWQVESR